MFKQNPVFRFLGQPLCRQECLLIEAKRCVELGVVFWGGIDPSLTAYSIALGVWHYDLVTQMYLLLCVTS